MKAVGVITFHQSLNYGAMLQACALQHAVAGLNHECRIIDYYRDIDHYRGLVKPSSTLVSPDMNRLKQAAVLVDRLLTYRLQAVRKTRSEAFRRDYLKLSERAYLDYGSLDAHPPLYDVYITGSDQVWNPFNPLALDPYFLAFAPCGRRRISYAASFGVSSVPEKFHEYYAKALEKMDRISVRETEGVRIVRELCGRQAEWVLDPTLLLTSEQWAEIASPNEIHEPYILCYTLSRMPYLHDVAKIISKKTGYRVYKIGNEIFRWTQLGVRNIFDAGPREFLRMFLNASFVLTNSFHGTAFSINFGKPFFSIGRPPRNTASVGSRITSLLDLVGLSSRRLVTGTPMPTGDPLDIDYSGPHRVLCREREKSIQFLRESIEVQ
jgi:hypothetical protein